MDGHPHSFRFPRSQNAYTPSLSEPRSPISDRERLNIPTASSLDLDDDDPRSSSELNSIRDGQDPDDSPHDPEDEPRISIYGPKMRFHSPAPWEEDDLDSKSVVEQPSISKRVKKKSESNKKGWPLSRVSTEARPSTDSTRSAKPKQSFDAASTISTNGALAYVSLPFLRLRCSYPQPTVLLPRPPCLPRPWASISHPIPCATSFPSLDCDRGLYPTMLAITTPSLRRMLHPLIVLLLRPIRICMATAAQSSVIPPPHPPAAPTQSTRIHTPIRTSRDPWTVIPNCCPRAGQALALPVPIQVPLSPKRHRAAVCPSSAPPPPWVCHPARQRPP